MTAQLRQQRDTIAQRLAHVAGAWFLTLALLASTCHDASAQSGMSWNSIGPPGGTVLSMLKSPLSDSCLYAGTADNGVFISADGGRTWWPANTGLSTTSGTARRSVRALVSDSRFIYAATDAGLFYSAAGAMAADAMTWTALADTDSSAPISLLTFDASTGRLFAAAVAQNPGSAPVTYVMSVPASGATPAASWAASPLPGDAIGMAIGAMAVIPATSANTAGLLVSAGNRVYAASVIPGTTALSWIDADPLGNLQPTGVIDRLTYGADFSQAYACSGGQLLRSSNPLDPQLSPWMSASVSPSPATPFNCSAMISEGFSAGGRAMLAVATNAGVYTSFDGTSFTATGSLGVSPDAEALAITGSTTPTLYVGAGFGVASQEMASITPTSAWVASNGPASVTAGGSNGRLNNSSVIDSAVVGATLFAAVQSDRYADVLSSTDGGATWTSTGLSRVSADLTGIAALTADTSNQIVYAGTSVGLFALPVDAGPWVAITGANVTRVVAMARGAGRLYVGTTSGALALPLGTTPSTASAVAAGLDGLRVSALHVAEGKVYAGTFDSSTGVASVSVATDISTGMPAWSDFASSPVGPLSITSLALAGGTLLAATRGALVSVAAPGGAWTSANNSASSSGWLSDPNGEVTSLLSDGTTMFAATRSNGVFASPLGATFTWTAVNGSGNTALPSLEVRRLRADGALLYAATPAGLAVFSGLAVSVVSPPPPSPAPAASSGGGALDGVALVCLALAVVGVAASAERKRRHRH